MLTTFRQLVSSTTESHDSLLGDTHTHTGFDNRYTRQAVLTSHLHFIQLILSGVVSQTTYKCTNVREKSVFSPLIISLCAKPTCLITDATKYCIARSIRSQSDRVIWDEAPECNDKAVCVCVLTICIYIFTYWFIPFSLSLAWCAARLRAIWRH